MNEVESFIYKYEGQEKEIMLTLYNLMSDFPGVTSRLTFNLPFFYRKSWICYLYPVKKGGIELVFTRGNELSDEGGLLNARGRKLVKGVIFKTTADIPAESLLQVINEALLLDENVPYQSPGRKK